MSEPNIERLASVLQRFAHERLARTPTRDEVEVFCTDLLLGPSRTWEALNLGLITADEVAKLVLDKFAVWIFGGSATESWALIENANWMGAEGLVREALFTP